MPVHWFNHPAVADIDNDGTKEIIYNTWIDSLHCFRYDGTTQLGFPVESRLTPDCGISEVILYDIDDDTILFSAHEDSLTGEDNQLREEVCL